MRKLLVSITLCFFSISSNAQNWKTYLDSAVVYHASDKKKALQFYLLAGRQMPRDSLASITYAIYCNNLGDLYDEMGQYEKAEPLYLEAKGLFARLLGKEHPTHATSCVTLAVLYQKMGEYEKAEPFLLETKALFAKLLGKDHPAYAATCGNLGMLYFNMGQYEKAELLYLETKAVFTKQLGKDHLDYAAICNNLAMLYQKIGQYEKAELSYLEAKVIREKQLGRDHPKTPSLFPYSCSKGICIIHAYTYVTRSFMYGSIRLGKNFFIYT